MKFFCIIFIIFYIPSCISPNPLNYIWPKKYSQCLLEYILDMGIVQTELFVKDKDVFGNYKILRRILPNDEIKNLKIQRNELKKYYIEKLEENESEANKKTEECFSMNKKVLEKDVNYLSMQNLFSLYNVFLSKEWQKKFDSLQNCMLDFILNSKLYKFGSFKPIFLDKLEEKTLDGIKKKVLLKAYKQKNNESNVVLQWKWGEWGELGIEMLKPEDTIFEEGDDGFEALKKCEQFELDIKKNNGNRKGKMVAQEKEKIDAMKLLKYFNQEQLFLSHQFAKKNSPEMVCVLEYILETRIVKTELFAKYISENYKILRRIVPNNEIKNLKIYKNDMNKYYFEKFENEIEANKKTEECFWINVEASNIDGNYLSMEKLISLKENQNVLSDEWHKKLDSLQNCMIDFIVNSKLYKFGNIKPISLKNELYDKTREEREILWNYKNNNDPNVVLQWNWGVKMPKPEETIYEEGHHGFLALKKCQHFELAIQKKNREDKMLVQEKEKIDAMELLKYFKQEQLFLSHQFAKKYSPEIKCIVDYILETRIVQTEIFSEHLYDRMFHVFRRIVPNDGIKNLKIHKNDMNKYYFEKLENNFEAIEKTEECFSMNVQALEEDRNYLSMEKLFNLTENRLILTSDWMDKLANLQECLLDFLVNSKFFTFGNFELIDIFIRKKSEERVILIENKLLNDKYNPFAVLQWKWGQKGMPKPEETIYEEGDDGFEALKKCEQMMRLVIKENGDATISEFESSSTTKNLEAYHQQHTAELNGKMVAQEKEKIDLMKLLKYFNQEQLFLRHFPNVVYYAENKNIPGKNCAICLEDYKENDKLERLYCGHYFHWNCMQNNRNSTNYKCKCPICRANLRTLIEPMH